MGKLWVPPTVEKEWVDERHKFNAALMEMVEPAGPIQAEWNRVLNKIDPLLMMVKAKENAEDPGLIPGYWHLLRLNPGAPASTLPITNPDGSYAEPSHRTLEWLRSADLQNPQVVRDREEAMARRLEQKDRDEARDTEERVDELEQRWAAATRTQVSMNTDTPWAQNAAGARRRYKRDPRRTEE